MQTGIVHQNRGNRVRSLYNDGSAIYYKDLRTDRIALKGRLDFYHHNSPRTERPVLWAKPELRKSKMNWGGSSTTLILPHWLILSIYLPLWLLLRGLSVLRHRHLTRHLASGTDH